MHQLATSFFLGYHGCDRRVGERILKGEPFRPSDNEYDWLGPGVYFWEANPNRGLQFAQAAVKRKAVDIKRPYVVGAVISLGLCLDLTTSAGVAQMVSAYRTLIDLTDTRKIEILKKSRIHCCGRSTER